MVLNNFIINNLLVFLLFAILVNFWLVWSSYFNFNNNRNENSPFECGFENDEFSRTQFSLRFFFILLVFVIFDVELTFFYHIPLLLGVVDLCTTLTIMGLIIILFVGLVEEWREGLIDWRE